MLLDEIHRTSLQRYRCRWNSLFSEMLKNVKNTYIRVGGFVYTSRQSCMDECQEADIRGSSGEWWTTGHGGWDIEWTDGCER